MNKLTYRGIAYQKNGKENCISNSCPWKS